MCHVIIITKHQLRNSCSQKRLNYLTHVLITVWLGIKLCWFIAMWWLKLTGEVYSAMKCRLSLILSEGTHTCRREGGVGVFCPFYCYAFPAPSQPLETDLKSPGKLKVKRYVALEKVEVRSSCGKKKQKNNTIANTIESTNELRPCKTVNTKTFVDISCLHCGLTSCYITGPKAHPLSLFVSIKCLPPPNFWLTIGWRSSLALFFKIFKIIPL